MHPSSTEIQVNGRRMSGEELELRISGMTVWGSYAGGFRHVSVINPDGTMEGRNNVGAHHFGRWTIDMEDGSLSVHWDWGWDNTTTYAYEVADEIRFHDVVGLGWRTTFDRFAPGTSGEPSGLG